MPMLAGPGSISLLIAFYQEHNTTSEIIISTISIAVVAVTTIYLVLKRHYLAKMLGSSGIVAISKLLVS